MLFGNLNLLAHHCINAGRCTTGRSFHKYSMLVARVMEQGPNCAAYGVTELHIVRGQN